MKLSVTVELLVVVSVTLLTTPHVTGLAFVVKKLPRTRADEAPLAQLVTIVATNPVPGRMPPVPSAGP